VFGFLRRWAGLDDLWDHHEPPEPPKRSWWRLMARELFAPHPPMYTPFLLEHSKLHDDDDEENLDRGGDHGQSQT
jgi:hypothetical protein